MGQGHTIASKREDINKGSSVYREVQNLRQGRIYILGGASIVPFSDMRASFFMPDGKVKFFCAIHF